MTQRTQPDAGQEIHAQVRATALGLAGPRRTESSYSAGGAFTTSKVNSICLPRKM